MRGLESEVTYGPKKLLRHNKSFEKSTGWWIGSKHCFRGVLLPLTATWSAASGKSWQRPSTILIYFLRALLFTMHALSMVASSKSRPLNQIALHFVAISNQIISLPSC